MNWNAHWNLKDKHAFLGASKWRWVNYDTDKIISLYQSDELIKRGTRLHALAAGMISEGIRADRVKKTFNMYVNDAIKYKMSPEVVLYYSDNIFGTTDAIAFDPEKHFLRIHDLKTGETPAHMEQLMIYAALFCLEYRQDPSDIDIELRIYQNNEIVVSNKETDPELSNWIKDIMHKAIEIDKVLYDYKRGE